MEYNLKNIQGIILKLGNIICKFEMIFSFKIIIKNCLEFFRNIKIFQ